MSPKVGIGGQEENGLVGVFGRYGCCTCALPKLEKVITVSSPGGTHTNCLRLPTPHKAFRAGWGFSTADSLPIGHESAIFASPVAYAVLTRAVEGCPSDPRPHRLPLILLAWNLLPQLLHHFWLPRKTHQRLGRHLGYHQPHPICYDQHYSSCLCKATELSSLLHLPHRGRKLYNRANVAACVVHSHIRLPGHLY